jgi:peptidoglycan glycosyltransferase
VSVLLNRQLRTLTLALIICFAGIALSAAYWATLERDRLLARQDNPRLLEDRASIQRGAIYDRGGNLLVHTQSAEGSQQALTRLYLSPAFNGALGYFSLTYGTGGVEGDYDRILAGADRPRTLEQILFGAPVVGSDIQTTLDSRIQEIVSQAFGGLRGAAVVMSVPDGDILAILSRPTFEPNMLDADWQQLLEDPGNPFFNRALQGRYQPGGMAQLPLLTLFDLADVPLDAPIADASAPVRLNTTLLTCLFQPPSAALTMTEALLYGCPAPSLRAEELFQSTQITRALQQLNPGNTQTPPPSTVSDTAPLRDSLLGQGQQVVSPLDITRFTSAIVNSGNAPQSRTLLAIRPPGSESWSAVNPDLPTIPVMTLEAAQHLREMMFFAESTRGITWAADVSVGTHMARAYAGDETLVWFTGYASRTSGSGVVVTVVVEGTRDPQVARSVGVEALQAAISATRP